MGKGGEGGEGRGGEGRPSEIRKNTISGLTPPSPNVPSPVLARGRCCWNSQAGLFQVLAPIRETSVLSFPCSPKAPR